MLVVVLRWVKVLGLSLFLCNKVEVWVLEKLMKYFFSGVLFVVWMWWLMFGL